MASYILYILSYPISYKCLTVELLKTIKDLEGLRSLRPSLKTLGLTFSGDSVAFQSVWLGHVGPKPPPVIHYI